MAKAHIETIDGATVNLEGTPAEIAAVLKELNIKPQPTVLTPRLANAGRVRKPKRKTTLVDLLDELIADHFFKKPKGLGQVKEQLANLGHHYPLTSLSGPLQRIVKSRRLRRFKESGKYVYAQ